MIPIQVCSGSIYSGQESRVSESNGRNREARRCCFVVCIGRPLVVASVTNEQLLLMRYRHALCVVSSMEKQLFRYLGAKGYSRHKGHNEMMSTSQSMTQQECFIDRDTLLVVGSVDSVYVDCRVLYDKKVSNSHDCCLVRLCMRRHRHSAHFEDIWVS